MTPYFSVIIPTLNEEEYISKILNDLIKQKNKNFEIIVVDGESKDKTKEKVREFDQILPINFYTVDKKNVSFQKNFGAKKAKGEFLIFLDADSSITSSFVSNLKNEIIKKKGLFFIPHITPEEKYPQVRLVFGLVNFLIEFSQNINKPFSSGGVMFIETNFFRMIGGFEEKLFLGEDHNLVQKALKWGVRTKFLNNVRVKFSLRRMKREGQLVIFYKYVLATVYILFKGDIKKKICDYSMGGKLDKAKKNKLSNKSLKYYLKQIENFFKTNF